MNATRPVSPTDPNPDRLATEVTENSATIYPRERTKFPTHGVLHELLHIERFQTAKSMVGIARWGDPEERGFVHALGRSAKYFMQHDMLPLPLEVARKRNGEPYKGGSVQYVLRGSNTQRKSAVMTTRSVKRIAIDPRTIRIDPHRFMLFRN